MIREKIKVGQKYRNATRSQIVEVCEVSDTHITYYCEIVKRGFMRLKDSFFNLYILVE